MRLQIVSKRWSTGRGNFTSVERFCSLLIPDFGASHGKLMKIPYRLGQWLKGLSNSRVAGAFPGPYNSYSAQIELQGIWEAFKKKPDVVFFPYADYDYYYMQWGKKWIGCKVVLWSFFSEWELKNRFKNLKHFEKADLILVAGHGQFRYMSSQLPNSNVRFFPLGVDTSFFAPTQEWDPFTIVHSGANRRDFDTLIRAFDRLVVHYPQCRLELIGASSAREKIPYRQYLTIHGELSDSEMLKVYQKSNFLVLSVTDGGSSNSLNEGMACGLPVIVTAVTNITDYVDDSFSLLFGINDDLELFEKMMVLMGNREVRDRYSKNARNHALQYDWFKLKDDFYELLSSQGCHA